MGFSAEFQLERRGEIRAFFEGKWPSWPPKPNFFLVGSQSSQRLAALHGPAVLLLDARTPKMLSAARTVDFALLYRKVLHLMGA